MKTYKLQDKTQDEEQSIVEVSETKEETNTNKTTPAQLKQRIKERKKKIKQLTDEINEMTDELDGINNNTELSITVPAKVTIESNTPEKINIVE